MIYVSITQKNIAQGKRFNCTLCPLALAMTQKGLVDVEIGMFAYVGKETYKLSLAAKAWIYAFDNGKGVSPARFRLTKV